MDKVLLEDVCYILDNQRVPIAECDRKKGHYPYYGANGVQDYVDNYIFDDELVLLAEDGGNFGSKEKPIAYRVSGKCWVNNHAHVLKAKDNIDVDYLCYSLMFYDVSSLINGATRQKLTQSSMRKILIPLFSLEEQQRIANELDKVSVLIEKRQKQLEKLDLLIKSRFIEMFGDPLKNEKKWKKAKLKDICNKIGDGLHGTPNYDDKGEYYFINGNNLENGAIRIYKETKKVNRREFEKHKIDLSVNSILLSINGTLGKLAYYREEPIVLGKSVCFLDIKENYNKIFAYHIMRSESFQQYINQNSTQSTIRNVGLKDLREITLINPQLQIQNKFANFVKYVEQSKTKIKNSLEKLITLKKALMQKYFG